MISRTTLAVGDYVNVCVFFFLFLFVFALLCGRRCMRAGKRGRQTTRKEVLHNTPLHRHTRTHTPKHDAVVLTFSIHALTHTHTSFFLVLFLRIA